MELLHTFSSTQKCNMGGNTFLFGALFCSMTRMESVISCKQEKLLFFCKEVCLLCGDFFLEHRAFLHGRLALV